MLTSSEVWERDDCNGRAHFNWKTDKGGSLFNYEIGEWVEQVSTGDSNDTFLI